MMTTEHTDLAAIRRLAEEGDADAALTLGLALAMGRDFTGAELWLRRAAGQGDVRAMTVRSAVRFSGAGRA